MSVIEETNLPTTPQLAHNVRMDEIMSEKIRVLQEGGHQEVECSERSSSVCDRNMLCVRSR
jgi:hypothetical protein